MFQLMGSKCWWNECNLQYLSVKSRLNTVCSSYLKHPASEEILAAHSAERWARWNEPCRSCGLHLITAKRMKVWYCRYGILKDDAHIFRLNLQIGESLYRHSLPSHFHFYARKRKITNSHGHICLSFNLWLTNCVDLKSDLLRQQLIMQSKSRTDF